MRHKTFLFNPELAINKGIIVHKCIQNPGEFVITLGKSYHAGFNLGFNCAEAVNFANRSWINIGLKAKSCDCQTGSVKVDMNYFIKNLLKSKKLKKNDKKILHLNKILYEKDSKEIKTRIRKEEISEDLEKENAPKVEEKRFLNKKRKPIDNKNENKKRKYQRKKV